MDADEVSRTALRKAHDLGKAIAAAGSYESDSKISLAMLMKELDVSRPMAREVLQVLQDKGMVALRSRTGATVLPSRKWNLLDPDVIQWRLEGSARIPQLNALTQLREAIEPRAAYLAAVEASEETRRNLIRLSRDLRTLGQNRATFASKDEDGAQHREEYSKVDVDFHSTLLDGSRNEIFAALAGRTAKALEHRIKEDWAGAASRPNALGVSSAAAIKKFPLSPAEIALWLHCGLAHAVNQGRPTAAEAFARAILAEIRVDGLDDPILRHGLTLALTQLDRFGFEGDELDKVREAVRQIAPESADA
jgi:DNA-binding FadR family transcriptional regulator